MKRFEGASRNASTEFPQDQRPRTFSKLIYQRPRTLIAQKWKNKPIFCQPDGWIENIGKWNFPRSKHLICVYQSSSRTRNSSRVDCLTKPPSCDNVISLMKDANELLWAGILLPLTPLDRKTDKSRAFGERPEPFKPIPRAFSYLQYTIYWMLNLLLFWSITKIIESELSVLWQRSEPLRQSIDKTCRLCF